ncbi:MAG: tRNA epoxyqueuosine(34) reductase QueG [Ignavibacteriae bacterium]|nr:tRNA epoxyqueuosine(34) reductase QueG [Ignavibacteria bacterium]MBI3364878.1 tRNA epoxyqueuosine(34) reductase QueG [Ignavibacteriota bacterium]
MREQTEKIKREAYRLGFSKVGIARAEKLGQEAVHLEEWLNRGFHATMNWMAGNVKRRIDPGNILIDAKSVIAVAMNYYTEIPHCEDSETGKISRYAWGDDYHDVLSKRLQELYDFIKSIEPSAEGKVYVDTGPVMEKVWAERSGIGWIGKHTNVITQEYGSWVFLGEIIINVELEYDAPATDHCGTCTLCIEACPTEAIVEPYIIDSNRCISYLTIEHRGEIAEELGERFDRWIYGCDICQDVCPWNQKFALPTSESAFFPREHNVAPRLTDVVSLTEEEFSEKYRKSPMKRTKLRGLVRNAQTAASLQSTEKK